MHALSTGRPDGAHDTRVTSASEDNEDAPQLQARGVGCYVMGGGKRGEEAACVGELTVGAGVVIMIMPCCAVVVPRWARTL